jgi:hypothetical protein
VGSRLPNRRHRCRVDLYTHATTKVKWGPDYTDAIPVDRGSIQGDSLTVPLPHLHRTAPTMAPRWRQGYMHGCLAQKTMDEAETRRQRRSVRRRRILTNTLSDLQVQAHKLSSYSDWVRCSQRGQNNRVRYHTNRHTRLAA